MPRLQIELDPATSEALSSLARKRSTTPAALVAEMVRERIRVPVHEEHADPADASTGSSSNGRFAGHPPDAIAGSIDADPSGRKLAPPDSIDALVGLYDEEPDDKYQAPPDPMDALVGRYHGDRINDIDEVVYGR